jgi:glycosyltransferase involved in cell wall biosynthesis
MPSRRETFGMVFVEALFCGLPILYSRNWGVDGFFESGTVGYACDPGSLEDILTGIDMLIAQEVSLKARLVELAAAGALRQFQRDRIVSDYRAVLERVGSPVA